MKSSAGLFGAVVAILSLVSAVLLVTSQNYGGALLAVALGGGVAILLFSIQNIMNHLDILRNDVELLRDQPSSNNSLEATIKELKAEISHFTKLSESMSGGLSPFTGTPSTTLGAPTTALSPTPFANEPAPLPIAKNYLPPTSPSSHLPSPKQSSTAFSSKLNTVDDPNRTNVSYVVPKSPITAPNTPVSDTSSHDLMETTQSFLPQVPTNSEKALSGEKASNLSTESTIGFEVNPLLNSKPSTFSEAPKPTSKTHSKIKKRYSTFAGLSLNDEVPEVNKYREDVLTPPPPPPPPDKIQKKRYSTFAGLALGERSRINPPSSPSPNAIATSTPAPAKAGSPLSILAPSTITNLGFSKNTDGMGVSKEELISSSASVTPNQNIAPLAPATKGTRKRYQTFMGLSLSKTPQPIKRLEEPIIDSTTPLPMSGMSVSPSKAPAPSSLQAAINRGQQGNLVDGFCSLCGSPQAAANDYAAKGSEPEFCWYCGAKLK